MSEDEKKTLQKAFDSYVAIHEYKGDMHCFLAGFIYCATNFCCLDRECKDAQDTIFKFKLFLEHALEDIEIYDLYK